MKPAYATLLSVLALFAVGCGDDDGGGSGAGGQSGVGGGSASLGGTGKSEAEQVAETVCDKVCECSDERHCGDGKDACVESVLDELDVGECYEELTFEYYSCLADRGECSNEDEFLKNEECEDAQSEAIEDC